MHQYSHAVGRVLTGFGIAMTVGRHICWRREQKNDQESPIREWYLIQAWSAPAHEAAVLRQTDSYGASVRTH